MIKNTLNLAGIAVVLFSITQTTTPMNTFGSQAPINAQQMGQIFGASINHTLGNMDAVWAMQADIMNGTDPMEAAAKHMGAAAKHNIAIKQQKDQAEANVWSDKLLNDQKIALIDAQGAVDATKIKTAITTFITSFFTKQNFALMGGLSLATVGGYFGFRLAKERLSIYLDKPKLIRATSGRTLQEKLYNKIWPQVATDPLGINELVYAPEVKEHLMSYARATVNARSENLPYRNLLLYGEPGCGKTSFAMAFALELKKALQETSGRDVNWVLISGADFAKFKDGEDIVELQKVIDYINHSRGDTILIIDEIDALAGSRDGKDSSDRHKKIMAALLSETGTENKKFAIIGATNRRHALDTAMLDRMDEQVHIPRPGINEREKLLKLYIDKYIKPTLGDCGLTTSVIKTLAEKTENFSGRELSQLARALQAEISQQKNKRATPDMVNKILNRKLEQRFDSAQRKTVAAA